MKKIMIACFIAFCVSNIFGQGGTVPAGLPMVFGIGCDDKQDSGAPQGPHKFKYGQGTSCWDYSYAYLVPGWADNWGNGPLDGAWAKNEMLFWQGQGQVQVFTYYYSYGDKNWFNDSTNMTKYWKELKILFQVINANSNGKVIVHFEPDGIGFWKQANQSVTSGGMKVGSVASAAGVTELNGLADSLQGWSQGIVKMRDAYAPNKVLLAHHFTHWATGADIFSDSQTQGTVDTNVKSMTDYILSIENGKPFDLFFVDPSDRDADWYRKVISDTRRWTDPTHTWTDYRSWGKIGYIVDKISINLTRRGFMWQIPEGNTFYKTCNNSVGHFRDNHAQEFLPSVSANGSTGSPGDACSATDTTKGPGFWATRGIIGVLFGSGYYQDTPKEGSALTHTRDNPPDGTTNPTSDSFTGGPSFDVWGQATSNVADNDGGYIRNAVAKYCSIGKFPLGAVLPSTATPTSTATKTNTPLVPTATPTSTATKTNTPLVPTATPTFTATKTNTPLVPTATPTYTATKTATPIIPSATSTNTSTVTSTPVIPTVTYTPTLISTKTNTPVILTATYTFTSTGTIIVIPPTATSTPTRTVTLSPSSSPTNIPAGSTATNTFTVTPTVTLTATRTNTGTATLTATQTSTLVPTKTSTNTPRRARRRQSRSQVPPRRIQA